MSVAAGERLVVETGHWVAVVPYWAAWPFETLLLPSAPTLRLDALTTAQADDLAVALRRADDALRQPVPVFVPVFDGLARRAARRRTADDDANRHWQLHAHFYPPLLRSATVRKFMVGFEMLARRSATSRRRPPRSGCARSATPCTIGSARRAAQAEGA